MTSPQSNVDTSCFALSKGTICKSSALTGIRARLSRRGYFFLPSIDLLASDNLSKCSKRAEDTGSSHFIERRNASASFFRKIGVASIGRAIVVSFLDSQMHQAAIGFTHRVANTLRRFILNIMFEQNNCAKGKLIYLWR